MTPAELAALSGNPPQQEQQSSGFIDTLGKIALGAGLAGAALVGARRLGGTVDLSTVDLGKIRRGLGAAVRPSEAVAPPSRPAPATTAERLQRIDDVTRAARAERPQGVRQVALTGQKTDLPVARTPGTFQQFSREASGVAAAERLASDPELLSLVKAQAAEELSEARSYQAKAQAEYRNLLSAEADSIINSLQKEVSTVQSAAQSDFGPQEFLKAKGYVEDISLVDQHRGQALGRVDHFANAVNSAEDQATGRVKLGMQRNEDVNLAATEMVEDAIDTQIAKAAQGDPTVASVTELDSAINQVAATLPDGVPVDQAEKLNIRTQGIDLRTGERFALAPERPYRGGLQPGMQLETQAQTPSKGVEAAQKFLASERAEIASQLGEQGLPATAGRVEAELTNRLSGPRAWEYGPEYTQRKQALQLGATYDPNLFESVGTGVKPAGEVTIAGEAVPISSLREPVIMEATAERLQERVAEKKDWLGNIRLQEQQRQIQLGNEIERLAQEDVRLTKEIKSLTPTSKSFGSAQEAQQASSQRAMADVAFEQQGAIDARIDELQNELFKSAKRVSGAERSTREQIANLQPPEKLKTGIEEGQRIYFEQDPFTGEPIPGTQELRSERYAIETEAKRGGGRQVVEYDPLGQSGQAKDVYGTRAASELADDPTRRPTKTGPSRQPLTQPVTPQGLRGVDVTRDIMRIIKSAPPEKAQQLVAEYISKLQG